MDDVRNEATPEERLEAWIAERPGWTCEFDGSGRYVVRDPLGGLRARNPDAAVALEILEGR